MKVQLETEITKVEDALKTNDTDTIKSATDELSKVWNEVSQHIYSQQGPEGQPGPDGAGADQQQQAQSEEKKDEKEVEDASYEVVDDENDKK